MQTSQQSMRVEEDALRRPWLAACLYLALIGPFFFVSYGFANWFTAQREYVPSFAFLWEQHTPFWAWTIIPYWSIDVLYVASVFLCRTRAELRVHVLRLATITLLAVVCFLLFPLRFSFPRPEVGGFFGLLFDALTSFDLPYNQAPSLHIGLLWVITLRFAAHVKPGWRWLCYGWAALIAVSVLTTWQHHVIDVVTGFAAGVAVTYAIPSCEHRWRGWGVGLTGESRRRASQLARRYLAGAVVCVMLLLIWSGSWWGWLWAWPAVACGLVAAGYFGLGPSVFQKSARGKSSPSAAVLLAPVRLGSWVSWRLRMRRLPAAAEINGGLVLGAFPAVAVCAKYPRVGAVLDLTSEFSRSRFTGQCRYAATPRLDLVAPSLRELEESVAVLFALRAGGPPGEAILIHCALGLSRSAVVAAAWLVANGEAESVAVAIAQLRAKRPQIVLHGDHIALLDTWARNRTEQCGGF